MHSICVCIKHQNFELLVSSLPVLENLEKARDKYWHLKATVCDIMSEKCAFGKCDDCKELNNKFISEMKELIDDEEEVSSFFIDDADGRRVSYSQWETGKDHRCALIDKDSEPAEFLKLLEEQLVELKRHHFIWQKQRLYFKKAKENVAEHQVVVQIDFAENMTVTHQDAVQAVYFSQQQITLHNAIAYYRSDGIVESRSFCVINDDLSHKTSSVHAF